MSGQYPSIQHEWFEEVWNKGNAAAIDELLDTECTGHGLKDGEGKDVRGIEAFRGFYESFRSAFPDIHITIEQFVEQDDLSVAYCRCTATHSGEGFLTAPTGKPIEFTGMHMARVKDGRIIESWNCFDFLTVMQQLGAIPG